MLSGRTIFDEPHHQSLELLAVQALGRGDAVTAFRLADRRCRISPLPEPHSYVLRGDAFFGLGNMAAASADIVSALALAPHGIGANRRMLAWGQGEQRRQAALALIACDSNVDVLAKAIEIVRADGQRAIANVRIFDDAIEGWAVWEKRASLEVSVADDANRVAALFEPAPEHRFRTFGRATNFRLPRPRSTKPQLVLL